MACTPQAWAAAAPLLLLRSLLGLEVAQRPHTLSLTRPALPPWLEHVELRDIRLGDASVSIGCYRQGSTTGFAILARQGEVDVVMIG